MQTLRHHLRRWTWIALVAVLGIALAPAVSQAVAAASVHPWDEVCTALPATASAPAGGEAAHHGHADHCVLCVQLGAGPLPSLLSVSDLPRIERQGAPDAASTIARLPWRAAQPRGPPASA